jgi:hypothetical protein
MLSRREMPLKVEYGDIWKYRGKGYIVIPTNLGWRKDGANVMGRGLAAQAASLYPGLAERYGEMCRQYGERLSCVVVSGYDTPLILFPTKPLNKEAPWLSWQAMADLSLIEKNAKCLAELEGDLKDDLPILVPALGCGNGGLDLREVRPILERHLTSDRFVLVLSSPQEGGGASRTEGRGSAPQGL